MGTIKIELALALYYGSQSYNLEACKTICEYAGMAEEWEKATLENLEDLMEKALEKLNEN